MASLILCWLKNSTMHTIRHFMARLKVLNRIYLSLVTQKGFLWLSAKTCLFTILLFSLYTSWNSFCFKWMHFINVEKRFTFRHWTVGENYWEMRFAKTVTAIVLVSIQNAIFIASKRSLITGKSSLTCCQNLGLRNQLKA